MASNARYTLAASVIALGTAFALQPLSIGAGTGVVGVSTAQALDVGGSLGGGIGGDIGGGGGSAGGSVAGDAGGSLGGSAGGGSAGFSAAGDVGLGGSAAAGSTGGLFSPGAQAGGGVTAGGSADTQGGAASALRSGGASVLGYVGSLFGFTSSTASSATQTGRQAQAAAQAQAQEASRTAYETAMLSGNVRGAAQALVQISAGPISAATVAQVNNQVGIDASDRFVASLVDEARRIQAQVPSQAPVNGPTPGGAAAAARSLAPRPAVGAQATGAGSFRGGSTAEPSRAPAKS